MPDIDREGIGYQAGTALARLIDAARHPYERKMSRRGILSGTGALIFAAAGIEVFLLSSCDAGDPNPNCDINNGEDTCEGLPTLEVPGGYAENLAHVISPFVSLLPPYRQHVKILIHPAVQDTPYDGQGEAVEDSSDTRVTNIDLFLKDTSEKELAYGWRVVYHEAAHIFDAAIGDHIPSNYLFQKVDGLLKNLKSDDNQAVLNFLTESTYTGGYKEGHPGGDYRELFASTLNVMHFAVDEFRNKLADASVSSEIKKIVATICLTSLKTLQKFSANPNHAKMTFEQFLEETQFPYGLDLVQELMSIAQVDPGYFAED